MRTVSTRLGTKLRSPGTSARSERPGNDRLVHKGRLRTLRRRFLINVDAPARFFCPDQYPPKCSLAVRNPSGDVIVFTGTHRIRFCKLNNSFITAQFDADRPDKLETAQITYQPRQVNERRIHIFVYRVLHHSYKILTDGDCPSCIIFV